MGFGSEVRARGDCTKTAPRTPWDIAKSLHKGMHAATTVGGGGGFFWLPLSMLTVSGVGGEKRGADGMTYVQHRDKEAQEGGEIEYG